MFTTAFHFDMGDGKEAITLDSTQALYFTVITFTTIGYGDISPPTRAGESLFCTVWMIVGIWVSTMVVTMVTTEIRGKLHFDKVPEVIKKLKMAKEHIEGDKM